jgi:hypothetical protein
MAAIPRVVTHPVNRLVVPLPDPYEVAVRRYEELVPAVDLPRFGQLGTWDAVVELAARRRTMSPYADMTSIISQNHTYPFGTTITAVTDGLTSNEPGKVLALPSSGEHRVGPLDGYVFYAGGQVTALGPYGHRQPLAVDPCDHVIPPQSPDLLGTETRRQAHHDVGVHQRGRPWFLRAQAGMDWCGRRAGLRSR